MSYAVGISSNPPGGLAGGYTVRSERAWRASVAEEEARGLLVTVTDIGDRCRACRGSGVGARNFHPTTTPFSAVGVWGRWERVPCSECDGEGRIGGGQIVYRTVAA